jgi:Asp-tRNA(Asn)/Glu-tRNA(Gln) amidotransferase A subunit family amidase
MKSYDECDGLDLAALVAGGKASSGELLDEAIRRTRAVQDLHNPISQWHEEHARATIDAGLPDGPFRGVPFLLKDLTALKGTPTWAGSRLAQKLPPAAIDATLVERYKRAGLVIFGKTTTPELGLAPSTETTLTGSTAIRGTRRAPRGDRRAAPRWWWRRARSRSRTRPMGAGRSASPPPAAACSA